MNHTAEECYSKHGFSPLYKHRIKHVSNNIMGNSLDHRDNKIEGQTHAQHPGQRQEGMQFTQKQMEQIWKMVQDSKTGFVYKTNNIVGESSMLASEKGKCTKNTWILDTGATDHVICTTQHFSSFHKIKPIIVQLPNGSYVNANHFGTVYFSEHLFLTDVLYILYFNFNLISVQHMISSLNCILIFGHKIFQIQDTTSQRMIGRAELQNRLYYLRANTNSFTYTNSFTVNLINFDIIVNHGIGV